MNPIRIPRPQLRELSVGPPTAYGLGIIVFLSTLRLGFPPVTSGLDPSWKEVMAWAYLQHTQIGRDLIFTYGPTGFLYPLAYYIDGIFWPYVVGQIVLTAAFAAVTAALFVGNRIVTVIGFIVAFCVWSGWLPGEISWPLTLVFGTTVVINAHREFSATVRYTALVTMALIFAVLACGKFSLLPIWLLCVGCVAIVFASNYSVSRGILALCLFLFALPVVWAGCSQNLGNLLPFLSSGLEMSSGYAHAMGSPASTLAELGGLGCLIVFIGVCVLLARQGWRRNRIGALVPLLYIAVAMWAWRAYLTRGDHAPLFFAFMALLPFGLLCSNRQQMASRLVFELAVVSCAAAAANFFVQPPALLARSEQLIAQAGTNLHDLMHLAELQARRSAEWHASLREADLPKIRGRIGDARVDMMGVQQGRIIINGLRYTPRPAFQSYSAYTERLEKLNEAYYLGDQSPEYVVLKSEPIDGHLPTSEDALAIVALLRRYHPVLLENGFLLLCRDDGNHPAALAGPQKWMQGQFGTTFPVPTDRPDATLAFAKVELNMLGKLVSVFLREPNLNLVLETETGSQTFRLVRPTADAGFMISPLLKSESDWMSFYLGTSLQRVRSLRIDAQSTWQQKLFAPTLQVAFEFLERPALSPEAQRNLASVTMPGFSDLPESVHGLSQVTVEDGEDVLFLHAPAELEFAPAPGRYEFSAAFGIRRAALMDANCLDAQPDGVGISIALKRPDGSEHLLSHRELDPFHVTADRGVQRLSIDDLNLDPGDRVVYRVDPGHGGSNTACDWSYARDMTFVRK